MWANRIFLLRIYIFERMENKALTKNDFSAKCAKTPSLQNASTKIASRKLYYAVHFP